MALNDNWFTEICEECGTAFAFKLKGKLHEEQTPFQRIEIFETETFGNLMVIDGFVMLSARDNFFYHEMMSHPALFTHPDPRRVLVIGGGDCGTLREVLRHPGVELAQQVELDERVTRLSEQYFPELCESNNDARAELHFTDGIKWIEQAAPDSYDVVIIDSTDPIGQAARLFSTPFYTQCHRVLGTDGVLVAQSESPLVHAELICSMRDNMRDAGFADVRLLTFPQCSYPSGWWSATMAGKRGLENFREDDARRRHFETQYYDQDVHRGALALPPFARRFLDSQTGT